MPRRAAGPRLYLDPKRGTWTIRDRAHSVRTGCASEESERAQRLLAEYISEKYDPKKSTSPPIADVLLAYARDRLPTMKSRSAKYCIQSLEKWWGDKLVSDITTANCRAYAATKSQSAARTDLQALSAAVSYWHREYGPLDRIPNIPKPPPNEPRERWLTRSEAARLVWQSRRVEHLKRIILIGLHTGSRYGVIRRMEWNWIDLGAGTMRRRAPGSAENHNKRTPPIRIPRKLRHFLRRWHKIDGGSGHVVKYDGRPLQGDPHTAWEAACKRANIKGASLHTMRHTVATWLLQRNVDPFQAAGFLGMSLKTLTNRYAKHHPDHQREAADI